IEHVVTGGIGKVEVLSSNLNLKIILASGSPRRASLLRLITSDFEVKVSGVDETPPDLLDPAQIAENLAIRKAQAVADELLLDSARLPNKTPKGPLKSGLQLEAGVPAGLKIIGADTIVCLDQEILGKPTNPLEAVEMLQKLSGKTHRVITGVCVLTFNEPSVSKKEEMGAGKLEIGIDGNDLWRRKVGHQITHVTFRQLTQDAIESYVDLESPFDKAGGYAIQEGASSFVESIQGPLDNVIGLPLGLVRTLLLDAIPA
ncbi:MAG: Maf family protein, partial [Rhabdochlamydiaceae bacterium]